MAGVMGRLFGTSKKTETPVAVVKKCPVVQEKTSTVSFSGKSDEEMGALYNDIKKCYEDLKEKKLAEARKATNATSAANVAEDAVSVFRNVDAFHELLEATMTSSVPRTDELMKRIEDDRRTWNTAVRRVSFFNDDERLIIRQYLYAGLARMRIFLRASEKSARAREFETEKLERMAASIERCIERKMRIFKMSPEAARAACEKEKLNTRKTNVAVTAYATAAPSGSTVSTAYLPPGHPGTYTRRGGRRTKRHRGHRRNTRRRNRRNRRN